MNGRPSARPESTAKRTPKALVNPETLYAELRPGAWREVEQVTVESHDLSKPLEATLARVGETISALLGIQALERVHVYRGSKGKSGKEAAPGTGREKLGNPEITNMALTIFRMLLGSLHEVVAYGVEKDLMNPEVGKLFAEELSAVDAPNVKFNKRAEMAYIWCRSFLEYVYSLGLEEREWPDFGDGDEDSIEDGANALRIDG